MKEVTPTTNSQQLTAKSSSQKTAYKYAGRETLTQTLSKSIPKQFIPTKRIASIFGAIFILVLIVAAFQFPFGSLMSGNTDVTIKVGYPMTFLELELVESDTSPIKILGFIIDLILYIILAYAIDVSISLILKNPLLQTKKSKQVPIIFKDRKASIAEKVTQKVIEKKQLK